MKNTLKNKAAFFAQYWGQKIVKALSMSETYITEFNGKIYKDQYLLLKPISEISDDDANEYLCEIGISDFHRTIHLEQCKKELQDDYDDIFKTDYLRSKGYALPFMGLDVGKLIEYGWIKLNTHD